MSHVSASFSATIRVRLADSPGSFGRLASAIGEAGGSLGAIDLVRVEKGIKVRDVTVDAADSEHLERIVESVRAGRRHRGRVRLGSHVPDAPRRQDRDAVEGAGQDPRRPLDGVHARRRAHLPGNRRRSGARLEPDEQAEHRRRRLRRHRRAGARRHRPRGGDAGDGGQGAPVQGVRRRRRVAALPRHQGPGRDRHDREGDRPRLRRHQPRGHLRPAVLRDRAATAGRARHPGVPRRPAWHRDRGPRRAPQRAPRRRQAHRRDHGRDDRRRRRGCGGDGHPPQRRRPHRDRLRPGRSDLRRSRGAEPRQAGVRRAHEPRLPDRARRTSSSPAPTSTSASRCRAPSPGRGSSGWRTTRSCSRWPIRHPRSRRRICRPARSPSSRPDARTTRTRSTTCSPSPASSAVRSMSARARSRRA